MTELDWNTQLEGEIDPEELQRQAEYLEGIPSLEFAQNGMIEAPLLPLREVIVFPNMISPLVIGRRSTLQAIEAARAENQVMIAVPQRNPNRQNPRPEDFLSVGVELAVSELITTKNNDTIILAQGRRRVAIEGYHTTGQVTYARGPVILDPQKANAEQDAQIRHLMRIFDSYINLIEDFPPEAVEYLQGLDEPGWIADMISNSFPIRLEARQEILGLIDVTDRLKFITGLLEREVEVLEIEEELDNKVRDEFDRGQRENYLRERMRAIQTELGESDPWARELADLRTKIRKAKLPNEPEKAALKEFERLFQMPPMSPEVGVIRTYIDWILELPWVDMTEDNLNINHAAEALDANHFALEKAKDRILEYIAVKSLRPVHSRQPILCFVGPPGTGKTSLARSIAEAIGREFVRLSLGGVRDEAEMRGHRRTYIGALPGRILQTMKRAGKINPLFLLDEIDKLGVGFRGDPAAALLEVLDPEQNDAFSDHYLEIPYDLSKVMFITTANSRDDIPWALLDRMEVIEFPGYVEEEKVEISKNFLIGRQIEESGLDPDEIEFPEQSIKHIIRQYTYEAGVRNLEREIGRVCRKVARLKAEDKKYPAKISITAVEKFLGPPQFTETEAERQDEIGVATGIAWTSGGGDIMPIEVLLMDGKGNLQLTGQLGEVMQESAQAALSYLKSRAKELKIDPESFEETDVHVHIPEGAIPKDGPSAGITMALAIISAFTGRKVRRDVGMTGEITLRGRVLPIGGVRTKVLAAHRAGLKTIILPEKNIKDMVDVPKKIKADLEVLHVSHMDEVLEIALLPGQIAVKKRTPTKPAGKKPSAPAASAGS